MIKRSISSVLCFLLLFSIFSPTVAWAAKENSQKANFNNQYIIKFKDLDQGRIGLSKRNKKVGKHFKHFKNHITTTLTDSELKELKNDPNIAYIEKDSRINKVGEIVSSYLKQIHVTEVQSQGIQGSGVKVAVMDTGIDTESTELRVAGGVSMVDYEPDLDDKNGHGTFMAGILAALKDNKGLVGAAPQVELFNIKVLDAEGTGTYSNVIQGIEWAIDNRMDIVSMSLAGSEYSAALEEAMNMAYEHGILLIAATGNGGSNSVAYPAKYDSVIAVGAIDSEFKIASFSNTGVEVELVAPGVNIQGLSLSPNKYVTMSGTSVSVPQVAGVAALLKSQNPTRFNQDIRNVLVTNATQIGESEKFGHGLVNAAAALGILEQYPISESSNGTSEDGDTTEDSLNKDVLTLDWLSQVYHVPESSLIDQLNKGYSLYDLNDALKKGKSSSQKLDEILRQINPNVTDRLQEMDYSAERFAEEMEASPPIGKLVDPKEIAEGHGEFVESSEDTIITDENLFYPSVISSVYSNQAQGLTAASYTYPTSYDQLAVKRNGIKTDIAPFSISSFNENVSTVSGSLQLQNADMVLPGRNGLSFALTRQYNSADAVYYDKDYFLGAIYSVIYYPELVGRLYYLYGEQPVTYGGSASNFFFTPYQYASFVQYIGQYTYWNYPTRYPVVDEFNNKTRKSFESAWRYMNPDDPQSYPFMSMEFNLYGTPLIAKAFTTGRVVQDPMHQSQFRGYAYDNRVKEIAGEKRFPLGKGWSWDIPYIETIDNKQFIHLFGGSTYQLVGTTLKGYPWKDLTFSYDSSVTINNVRSSYVLKSINGQSQYFDGSGALIQISDSYNNSIQFDYQNDSLYGRVLSKVRDAIGNEIVITYSDSEVILTMGDRTVRYKKTKDPQGNKELLSQVTDPAGRKTQYVYEVASTPFDLVGGGWYTDNYTALLKQVYHPTKARTDYNYESFTRNLGIYAKETAFRVKSREDVVTYTDGSSTKYNHENYTFYGDGAAVQRSNYSFSTAVNNGRTVTTYSYDKVYVDDDTPEVLYNTQIKLEDGTQQTVVSMQYNRDKRLPVPIKVTSKTIKGTSQSTEKTVLKSYDDYGNITSETNPLNIVTMYNYDPTTHLLSSIVQPVTSGLSSYTEIERYAGYNSMKTLRIKENSANGAIKAQINYVYDSYGNPITVTQKDDNRDIAVTFEYGAVYNSGFPTKQSVQVTDALGVKSTVAQQFEYNKLTGEMTKYIDGKGFATNYHYDKLGRMIKETYPDTGSTTIIYNDSLNEATVVDPTGVTTMTQWNPLGWKVSTGINGKSALKFGYDVYGRLSWTDDGANNRTRYQYDSWDRIVRTDYPGTDNAFSTMLYDDINRVVESTDAEGNRTRETSDVLGRVSKQDSFNASNELASSANYTYDYAGNVLTIIDGKNEKNMYTYDVLNRLQSVTDPDSNTTRYQYNLAGNLTQIEYPDQNKMIKQYDETGRLIQKTDPDGRTELYFYDANSNLNRVIDRKGQLHTYGYNNRNFHTSSKTASETITFDYDKAGRRLWMHDGTGKTQYIYDPSTGWLTSISYPDKRTIQYEYDNQGKRTRMTDPFGIITVYMYDNQNRLEAVGPAINEWDVTYKYKKNGLASSSQLRNGLTTEYGYSGLNLSSLSHKNAGTAVVNTFSYNYDLNRNLIGKTENGTSQTFMYDKLNRIAISSEFAEQYTYDKRGNRMTLASDKQLDFPNVSFQYDDRDRLIHVNIDESDVTYRYNGDGLLVERTEKGKTTRYYNDGAQIIAEGIVTNGAVTHKASYIRGNGLAARVDSNGNRAYYLLNGHGDVVGLTDGEGSSLNQYSYDIWGNPLTEQETITNPFRYSGEFWDSTTELQYLRARWYDPSVGRFINEDTYEGQINNPLTLNLYTYVSNNPLRYKDPTGHAQEQGAGVGGSYGFYTKPLREMNAAELGALLDDPTISEDEKVRIIAYIGMTWGVGATQFIEVKATKAYSSVKSFLFGSKDAIKASEVVVETFNFSGPASRHYFSKITQSSVAKEVNTVIMPGVDVSADVLAINAGKATRSGNNFTINGRTYGMHDGTLYPIYGDGFVQLNRGAYKALGVFNKFGNTSQANKILDNMGVSDATRNAALNVYNAGH